MNILQLYGQYLYACPVAVKNNLQKLRRIILDLQLAVRNGCINKVVTYDLAHGSFCCIVHKGNGISHIEQELHGVLDFVLYRKLHIDDVFIAGQHGRFPGHGLDPALLEGRGLSHIAVADFGTQDLGNLGLVDGFQRHGQGVMGPRAGGAVVFAKAKDNTFFIWVYDIDA